MKRSAEEASLLDDEVATLHRVSMTASSSSSLSSSTTSKTKPLYRTLSTLTNNDETTSPRNKNSSPTFLTRFTNARILQRDGSLQRGELTVDSNTGIITQIHLDSQLQQAAEDVTNNAIIHDDNPQISHTVDCQGMILSPGFIDIQLNGAYGIDFSNGGCQQQQELDYDCDAEKDDNDTNGSLCIDDIFQVATSLCQSGVTSFCPTMVSSSRDTYRRVIPLIDRARRQQQQQLLNRQQQQNDNKNTKVGANILGMHLEGPFFDGSKRGAHDERHILAPSKGIDTVREVYGLNDNENNSMNMDISSSPMLENIDIITLAPELEGALDATKSITQTSSASEHNVVVSCGHTGATYEDGLQAISHGATLLTHLFNAMNPFHHRKPGLVGLLSSKSKLASMGLQRPFYSLIVDGIHVHESAVSMAYNSHPDGCVLVTDAMSAMGLGDGTHALGDMSVSIQGDRAVLAGTDTLAGSVVSMDTCVRRFRKFTGCSTGKALLCATLHPANVLNRSGKWESRDGVIEAPIGVLEVGARADLVVVTDELDVVATWVHGRVANYCSTSL
mmetsp:Transcript_3925/g.5741  ORF Transcript_3925/g.5741 Transcript_3925/m.5741 type:complete len:559 (+) Transcript_3925:25-1701(+)